MDDHYAGQNRNGSAVCSQIVRQLADPQPKDAPETAKPEYVGALSGQWLDWSATVDACRGVAAQMLTEVEASWR